MICRLCGQPVIDERRFCDGCGAPLPLVIDTGRRQRTRQADTYLDGTPVEEYIEPAPSALHPQASIGLMDWSMENTGLPKKRERVLQLYPDLIPGKTGFFGKMFFLFTDPQLFFTRLDMEKELPAAFAYLSLVIAAGIGATCSLLSMFGAPAGFDIIDTAPLAAATGLFFLLLSFSGMALLTFHYKRWASWRRVFAVFSFSSLPVSVGLPALILLFFSGPSMLPALIISFYAFVLLLTFSATGLEFVFGIDPLPANFWAFTIFATSAGIASSILLFLNRVFGISLVAILKNMI